MSLRIKLILFTVTFVLLASMAILGISVLQIHQKEKRDIQTLRTNELKRLQISLQNSVNLICSAIEDQSGKPEMSSNLAGIIKKLKKSTKSRNTHWIWVLDTGNVKEPIILSEMKDSSAVIPYSIVPLLIQTRDSGDATIESSIPEIDPLKKIRIENTHLYWYAQSITPGGWILAAGAPLSALDSTVNERSQSVEMEIARIVKDRMLFSLILIITCACAIFLFSKRISDPVNRLVKLTESIAEGKKGFTEEISLSSHDEIGRLAGSFNAMLRHVQSILKELEETATKYRELVENANSAIIHIDCAGKVLFVNEYAQQLFGYSAIDVEEKNILETIGKTFEVQVEGDDMFLAPEKYPYLEREHITSMGKHIWVGWTNRPIFDKNHKLIETLCVGSDITKSKETEEFAELQRRKLIQADKMATLGILVSGIAHEINNPNNYIVLNAQSLQGMWDDIAPVLQSYSKETPDYAVAGLAYNELSKEIPAMFKGITDGALRIKNIVQNLKDFARMEPEDMDQRVDITKVFEAAQIILSDMIKKSISHVEVTFSKNLPIIRGNFQQIEQVIINLLANACQATNDILKPVLVQVSINKNCNELIVSISDKGCGIKPLDMKRIFDPFFTTKRSAGGTGLGLAVSYSIVKNHGGDLQYISEEGKATTAILTLPIDKVKRFEEK